MLQAAHTDYKTLLLWQDRLIALDAADEFFKMASVVYPKRASVERVDEKQVSAGMA